MIYPMKLDCFWEEPHYKTVKSRHLLNYRCPISVGTRIFHQLGSVIGTNDGRFRYTILPLNGCWSITAEKIGWLNKYKQGTVNSLEEAKQIIEDNFYTLIVDEKNPITDNRSNKRRVPQ